MGGFHGAPPVAGKVNRNLALPHEIPANFFPLFFFKNTFFRLRRISTILIVVSMRRRRTVLPFLGFWSLDEVVESLGVAFVGSDFNSSIKNEA